MERTIDSMIDFFLYEMGEDIRINGEQQKALVLDAVDKINQYDDKIIHTIVEIKTGDIIQYKGLKYLITSQIDKNSNSYCARIKQCNYRIAFNFSGNIKLFDALIETKVMDVESNQIMKFASGKIMVSIQDNADSKEISLAKRFINTGRAWKVIGIDKSIKGMIILTCDLDYISNTDDIESGIAERWAYETKHNYVLTIDNGDSINVLLNDISQLNVTVKDNGVVMNPIPALTFISADSNIVSVDNTGKIMGINLGSTAVTCKMMYNTEVADSIDVTVEEFLAHVYTVDIAGSATIKQNRSQSYVAHIYDNGREVFNKSVVWSIRNQDGTSTLYANITATTGNSATVTAGNTLNKYVILKAALSDDPTVFKEFTIRTISLI